MTRRFAVHLIICMAIAPGISRADEIYDTLLSGNTYQCCTGNMVTGPDATNVGATVGLNQIGAAFTPTATYILTQLDVAFYFPLATDSTNTNGFTITLYQDSGGVPGKAIETWTVITAPSQAGGTSGTSSVVETVLPLVKVTLSAGQQYWIVATPAGSNTFDVWAANGTGSGATEAQNSGSGWSAYSVSSDGLAFDVQGDPTPEPGTFMLIPLAAVGLGLIGKLRRKA